MRKLAAALLACLAIGHNRCRTGADRIEQFKAWGRHFYQGASGKVCYVLTVPDPKQLTPPKVDHGDVFFLVTQRPAQNISYEPQAMVGYEMQAGSKVTIKVDDKTFTMFTKGQIGSGSKMPPRNLRWSMPCAPVHA